jgi:SMC interacting uncharacterized protein involved in chromosome segregation
MPTYLAAAMPLVGAGIVFAGRTIYRYMRKAAAMPVQDAVDDAKDELITTLERNHAALVTRVETLEVRLAESETRADELEQELTAKASEFEALKQYAAPDGFRLVLLRLTEIEDRQETSIESLTEAVTILRQVAERLGR